MKPSRIAIVTDSTAYLPEGMAQECAIRIVPIGVAIGEQIFAEGLEITPAEVAQALQEKQLVTTARPGPAAFDQMYAECAQEGYDAVVSIHISAKLSATYESAVIAAARAPIPVTVIDSQLVGMGLGFAVLRAAALAQDGVPLPEIETHVRQLLAQTTVLFYVDTLEYLRRGGRIGLAKAAMGTALGVKPLLQLDGGQVVPLENIRTTRRALERLVDLVVSQVGVRLCDIAIHHLAAPERAQHVAQQIQARLPQTQVLLSEVGAVVGAHAGPGLVGVVVAPQRDGQTVFHTHA